MRASCLAALCDLCSSHSFQAAVTALYAKLLVIMGFSMSLSEILSHRISPEYFQMFYVYLFSGSLLYLTFVYMDLVIVKTKSCISNWGKSGNRKSEEYVFPRNWIDNNVPGTRSQCASFYLRIGTVLFGIGSLIHTGIEIGDNFEAGFYSGRGSCLDTRTVLRSSLQMFFIFFQMYFVFLNHKMNIYNYKFLSRLGLMHMIATNLCVWLKVLILETLHEIDESHGGPAETSNKRLTSSQQYQYTGLSGVTGQIGENDDIFDRFVELGELGGGHGDTENNFVTVTDDNTIDMSHVSLSESCFQKQKQVMHDLHQTSGPFLFPCTIEFSLISAAILFIMWKHVGREHENLKLGRLRDLHCSNELRAREATKTGRYSIDCSKASTGLFCGIVVLVVTIISLIVFFVFISNQELRLRKLAVQVAAFSELTIYSLTSLGVMVAMWQMRRLCYDQTHRLELDNLLLVIAQSGVFIYASFSIIGTFFQLETHLAEFLASLLTLVQATLQTVFILDASCRFACTKSLAAAKPGRQMVTFLLVCNLALWLLNTLETSRSDAHPIQVEFYGGGWAWPMISHIAMPLAIFYRFHSTVCLFEIWKKSFKLRRRDIDCVECGMN